MAECIIKYGDDAFELIGKYGDAVDAITTYGDDAVDALVKYGDDVAAAIGRYGDDAMDVIGKYGDDAVESLKNGRTPDEIRTEYGETVTSEINAIIESIPDNLKEYGHCDEFAQLLVDSLDENKIKYKIIRIDSEFGIYSDKAGMSIGINYHYGIQVGDMVYDNITTEGMQLDAWLEDLGLTGEFSSIKWYYTDSITNY